MEINKLNELYTKLEQKYSFGDIDANKDGQITEQEVLTLAYKDEELRAELSSSDIESISEFINIDETSSVNQNSSVNSTVNSSLLSNISTSDIQQLIVYLCTL